MSSTINTLSSFPGAPFNDTLETFFDTHTLGEDVECYQFLFCPYGTGQSFSDLNNIDFQSRVVILNTMDLMQDKYDNLDIEGITNFCNSHPDHKFIIFHYNLNLQSQLSIPNLYSDAIIPTNLTGNLRHCEKTSISNRYLCLNNDTKVHRVMLTSYLLSKNWSVNGDFTFNYNNGLLARPDQYRNIVPVAEEYKSKFAAGYERFKAKDFTLLDIGNFAESNDRVVGNYHDNLLPVFETHAIEIITGTMFFESVPSLTEKETQSIFAKNFPIYINGVGTAREIKKLFSIDIFDDIIDHSYDEVENHFERMIKAIDDNTHLLNGSTDMSELWNDNRSRFDANCERMDQLIFDKDYQRIFNHERIKKALQSVDVTVTI